MGQAGKRDTPDVRRFSGSPKMSKSTSIKGRSYWVRLCDMCKYIVQLQLLQMGKQLGCWLLAFCARLWLQVRALDV
eukprot:3776157-Amphidinium_carterae.1